MKGDYFSKDVVFDMLGGATQDYRQSKRTVYELRSGETIVIRSNSRSTERDYYFYNVQKKLFDTNVQYVVCVAGHEGIYKIPISIVSKCAEEGHLSLERNGQNYKLVLQRFSGNMCMRLTGSEAPIDVERYQMYHHPYEKTNEMGVEQAVSLVEGAKKTVIVNAYERNSAARRICIEHYGPKCQVCGFDFSAFYGSDYDGLIEVHHIIPISDIQSDYVVNPIEDLIPVCPNCHTAIHKNIDNRCLTVEELRERIAANHG